MTHDPRRNELPAPPPPRELFCIHSYAGEAGPPCGWRGSVVEARSDDAGGAPRCPRCGRVTLLRIPTPPTG
jgi:hypothetical protein